VSLYRRKYSGLSSGGKWGHMTSDLAEYTGLVGSSNVLTL